MRGKKGSRNLYMTLGASNHTDKERQEDDFYATDPIAIDVLCSVEKFEGKIWENSAGSGCLSERLKELGYEVISTDLVDRGYKDCESGVNFLLESTTKAENIVMNPPYKLAQEFIEHSLELVPEGGKVCAFLKVQFLEGKARKQLFEKYPPRTVYVSSSRILCAKNGDFEGMRASGGSAVAYCWFVWVKGFQGVTELKWVN